MNKVSVIDIPAAMERLDGDIELLKELVGEFLKSSPEQLVGLEAALASADASAARSWAHAIRGAAATVGAAHVADVASRMETAAQEGVLQGARALFHDLKEGIRLVENQTAEKSWLQEIPASPAEELVPAQTAASVLAGGAHDAQEGFRVLIVEDDSGSRKILQAVLGAYGPCDVAVNGEEAIKAFEIAHVEQAPYDLICLDILMPGIDGHEVLKRIRAIEREQRLDPDDAVKIIMATVLGDGQSVFGAFNSGCEAYLVKPISKRELIKVVGKLGLIA